MISVKLVPVFTIRIVYKSGYTHDFECTTFTIDQGTYSWEAISNANRPILLGNGEIAAVYQVGTRKMLVWK